MTAMTFWMRRLPLLFICASFLSAGLLFLSEPMIGKLLLPLFGGSPAVWNTCLVFFQAALLAGYGYAHLSVKGLGLVRQPRAHVILVLLPLLLLPVTLPVWADSAVQDMPVLRILAILTVTIGAPFFVLATSGPLLQRWFAASSHPRSRQPYFLYVASNIGSFAALLAYPFIIEPALSLKQQANLWAVSYGLFAVLVSVCVILLERHRQPVKKAATVKTAKASWKQRSGWLSLAFLPSSLMLGVTTYITTDVAAVPLLWIIPLALYLLTFVMAFGVKYPLAAAQAIVPITAAGLFATVLVSIFALPLPRVAISVLYIAVFTLIALVAHGRLAASRPEPTRLTEFYLWVATGGVLGGVFNGLLSPLIFNNIYELPIALLLTVPILVHTKKPWKTDGRTWLLALVPGLLCLGILAISKLATHGITPPMAADILLLSLGIIFLLYQRPSPVYGIGLLPVLAVPIFILANQHNLLTERTFYGVIKVHEQDGIRQLSHGVTKHGVQYNDPALVKEPVSYYYRRGPLSDALRHCQAISSCRHVGVIGLGTGTIAAYGRVGDELTFYEIDPVIARIAQNPRYFTYLQDSKARVETVIGDGRLSLEKTKRVYDVLVIDAFSSDAIPVHLLTREALEVYQDRLSPHGLLVVHISNNYLDLEPVLKAAARDQGLTALVRHDPGGNDGTLHAASVWAVLAKHEADLDGLRQDPGWRSLHGHDIRTWTDDYSNLLDALR